MNGILFDKWVSFEVFSSQKIDFGVQRMIRVAVEKQYYYSIIADTEASINSFNS